MTEMALITGASSGIGLELAKIFASNGIGLVLNARNHHKLYELKDELETRYRVPISVIAMDLSTVDAPGDLFEQVNREGLEISYLVNNAGFGDYAEFVNTDWGKIENMLNLNIKSLTQLTRLFLPQMVSRGRGRILNVGSVAGFLPGPLMAVYYASKSYVLSFSEALSHELAKTPVSVTVLCPGATDTEFQNTAAMQGSRMLTLMKRASAPEVAEYGYKAMMKGQTVAVHGGANRLLVFLIRLVPRKLVAIASKMAADKE